MMLGTILVLISWVFLILIIAVLGQSLVLRIATPRSNRRNYSVHTPHVFVVGTLNVHHCCSCAEPFSPTE